MFQVEHIKDRVIYRIFPTETAIIATGQKYLTRKQR